MAGYALLAGASAAALRAAAMGALVVVAGRFRRESHIVVSVALTGAVMLGLKPALVAMPASSSPSPEPSALLR